MVKSKNIHKNIFNLNSAENKNIQFSLGHQNNIINRKNSAFEKIWSKPKPNTGRRPIFKEYVSKKIEAIFRILEQCSVTSKSSFLDLKFELLCFRTRKN